VARREGNHALAVTLLKSALEGTQRARGKEHTETLSLHQNLANAYSAIGNHAAARDLMEPAVAAQRRILSDTHNETLCSMGMLAGNLAEMGDRTNAEALLQEVIAGFRQTLGNEHPDTLFAVANLAPHDGPSRGGHWHDTGGVRRSSQGVRASARENHPGRGDASVFAASNTYTTTRNNGESDARPESYTGRHLHQAMS
jgi:hypothetical protein